MASPRVRPAIALYAMAVLFVVNLTAYLDRQILSLLVQPIKASLHLSDGEVGLMQGLAFVVTLGIAALFIGRLIDRSNRRNLLTVCILIWSLGAAAGGLAAHGWQLFVARMAVGFGEAALMPCAISLISDLFTAERRGTAIGFFSMGIYAGIGLSLILVAFAMPGIVDLSRLMAAKGWALEPWRLVLMALLIPGILCCLLLATVSEPPRTQHHFPSSGFGWSGMRDWVDRARIFLPHHLAWSSANICQYAIAGWLPTVLIREHGFTIQSAGFSYGGVMAVFGTASAYLGGVLADRRGRSGGTVARIGLAIPFTGMGLAGFVIIALAPSAPLVLVGAGLVASGMAVMNVVGLLALADLSQPRSRGQITSIYLTINTIIAAAGGPALVGYGNDFFGGPSTSLSMILGTVGILSAGTAMMLVRLTMHRVASNPQLAGAAPARSLA